MKNKMLEELCTFADECVASNYGAFPICCREYIDCVHYQRIIARKIGEYNKRQEQLCPFVDRCSESDYGDEEICRNDYETCKNYGIFKKEEYKRKK